MINKCRPARHRHGAERGDERIDLEARDEHSVGRSEQGTDADRRENAKRRHARVLGDQGRRDGRQADNRADRKVEPSGDDHQRLAQGHDTNHGNLLCDIGQIARRQEIGADDRQDNEQQRQHDKDRCLAHREDPQNGDLGPPGRGLTDCLLVLLCR